MSGAGGGWGGEDGDLPINTLIFDDQIITYYFNYFIIKYYFDYYIVKYYFNYHIILKSIIMRICKMHGATLCLSDRPLQEAKLAVGGPQGGGLIRFVYVVEHALPLHASISALPRENISINCVCAASAADGATLVCCSSHAQERQLNMARLGMSPGAPAPNTHELLCPLCRWVWIAEGHFWAGGAARFPRPQK